MRSAVPRPRPASSSRWEEELVVIVLAAGRSERFRASGGRTHKLDALLNGVPVLKRVLAAVENAGLKYHVVAPDSAPVITPAHASACNETAPPPAYCTDGMGDSIASGVRATANRTGWLILPGDLPLIEPETLRLTARALERHAIVVPRYRGRSGHPVGFRSECGLALQTLSGDRGAVGIVHTYRAQGQVLDLSVDDAGVLTDIDTLDDLAHATAALSQYQSHKAAGSSGGISHGYN